jgi:hypothetical protein
VSEKRLLGRIVDLPDEPNVLAIDLRLKIFFEVGGFGARYLCGDAQGHSGCACDANGLFGSFPGREATQKSQI